MYYNGDGVTQSYSEAKKWFERACLAEDVDGCRIYIDLSSADE